MNLYELLAQPVGEHMPQPDMTALQQSLQAAGREFAIALGDLGYRLTAQATLGQVIAGLPDAAGGMILAMKPEQRRALADHAGRLRDIAINHTPPEERADQAVAFDSAMPDVQMAIAYLWALRGDADRMRERLAGFDLAKLQSARDACSAFMQALSDAAAARVDAAEMRQQ